MDFQRTRVAGGGRAVGGDRRPGVGVWGLAGSWALVLLLVACSPEPLLLPTGTAGDTAVAATSTASTAAATAQPDLPIATAQPTPTPVPPLTYVVQSGDSLGAVAYAYDVSLEELMSANGLIDPNRLQVGQVLIIPTPPPPTPTPDALAPTPVLPTPPSALPPAPPAVIQIAQARGAENVAAEVVVVRNVGGRGDLDGWTLADAEGNVFTFPRLTLFEDGQVWIYTGAGQTTPTRLYWGRTEAAWQHGELITLRDADGGMVDTYIVP